MSKKHHIEILKILKTNSLIKINENKSGIYINLSFLPNETISELYKYIDYISKQEDSLNNIENQKNMLKNEFLLFN